MTQRKQDDQPQPSQPDEQRDAGSELEEVTASGAEEAADSEEHWDWLDETSDQSFPASDPPGWIRMN